MFIKKLVLKNFRNFKNLDIDFSLSEIENRKRTLILGPNGTGKSNLLKSIALVTAGSNALGELLGNPNDWIKFGESECKIDLYMSTQKGEQRHIWLEIHRGDNLKDVMLRSTESLDEIDGALNHTERNYFITAYGASRIMNGGGKQNSFNPYHSQRSQCVASLLDKQSSLNSIEDWALDLDYRKEEEGLDIIKSVFNDFLDGIKFIGIDKKTKNLMLETQDGIVPVNALSDGYQNMVAWIGDLLYRITDIFSDRKEPLKTSGVLILDEIDLHLHPTWQRKLLAFIDKTLPNMQLIATTHSPFIAQQAGKDELFIIKRVRKNIKIDQYIGTPQDLLLHQLIMSDVFGIETDESYFIENLKEEHTKLINKRGKSNFVVNRIEEIEEKLNDVPKASYSNSLISEEERNMMHSILKTYNKK